MIARRVSHAILILCCGGFLTAADGGGCGPFPAPICTLECEHGFKTDSDGNTYCECKASDACILLLPAPHENPDTGECVSFPTVCDIPDGWGLCSASCTYGGVTYAEGDSFPADDGCNTCTCTAGGTVACTEMACVDGCTYDGVFYADGATFPSNDGCNSCTCSGTMVLCTLRACAPVCDRLDELTCDTAAGCEWLTPECGFVYPGAIEPGCYPSVDCQSDSDCTAGEVCEQVGVNPCYNSICLACSMVRGVCLPDPIDCFGAWWDQFGNCRGPADGMLPADCCNPTDPNQGLCEQSGGTWDPMSCGDYTCGGNPICLAIIPGCDCGPDKNFVDGAGCIYDASCGGACFADSDCPAGAICNTCPADPTCPMCTVCGPPVCEPIVCNFDVDCPAGSTCVGSSICPPDALCSWAGEPGVCLPATP